MVVVSARRYRVRVPQTYEPTIGDLGEEGLLSQLFERLGPDRQTAPSASPPAATGVLVGPGDDTAYLSAGAATLATTDVMVLGRDWLDEWSSPTDVGVKLVNQNLADLAAMAGVGSAVLLTLTAPPSLTVRWALDFVDGVVQATTVAGVSVAGGDLSSSLGEVSVAATALGRLGAGIQAPVLRSGARVGDVVAVSGGLGRSAAGLQVLQRGAQGWFPPQKDAQNCSDWVGYHTRPWPDLEQGPVAGRAGATAMIDISDGLLRDAGRIGTASAVTLDLRSDLLAAWEDPIAAVLGRAEARRCVQAGGEEHTLLATFRSGDVPSGWTEVGRVSDPDPAGQRVRVDGQAVGELGWDHFSAGPTH